MRDAGEQTGELMKNKEHIVAHIRLQHDVVYSEELYKQVRGEVVLPHAEGLDLARCSRRKITTATPLLGSCDVTAWLISTPLKAQTKFPRNVWYVHLCFSLGCHNSYCWEWVCAAVPGDETLFERSVTNTSCRGDAMAACTLEVYGLRDEPVYDGHNRLEAGQALACVQLR